LHFQPGRRRRCFEFSEASLQAVLSISAVKAISTAVDRETRYHLEDVRDQIAKALDPKFATPTPATPTGFFSFGFDEELFESSDPSAPLFCWHDYSVKREPETPRLPKQD
jgi:hypothetical protein